MSGPKPFVRNQIADLEGAVLELNELVQQLERDGDSTLQFHANLANEIIRRTTLLAALGRASVALNLAVRNATQQMVLEEVAQLRSEEPVGFWGRLYWFLTGAKAKPAHEPSKARWDEVQRLAVAAIAADQATEDFAAGLAFLTADKDPAAVSVKPSAELEQAARAVTQPGTIIPAPGSRKTPAPLPTEPGDTTAAAYASTPCPACNGRGVIDVQPSGLVRGGIVRSCMRCLGTGRADGRPQTMGDPPPSTVPEPAAASGGSR